MSRCCCGGIPSFSSTRSLIRSTLSVGSMSISISFPVSVWNRQGFHESYSLIYNLSSRENVLSWSLGSTTFWEMHILSKAALKNQKALTRPVFINIFRLWTTLIGQILGTIWPWWEVILHFPSYPTRILENTGIPLHETAMRSVLRKVFL